MYDQKQLEAVKPCCLYAELYKKNEIFCKISKSDESIKDFCMEDHYIDYTSGGLISDKNPDGHGFLSFSPLSKICLLLSHGDTLTLLDTNKECANMLCPDNPVRFLGGMFDEYIAPQVIVKKNLSLENVDTSKYIIGNSDPQSLYSASNTPFAFSRVSRHFEKLGFSEASLFWKDVESFAKEGTRSTTSFVEKGKMIIDMFGIKELAKDQRLDLER